MTKTVPSLVWSFGYWSLSFIYSLIVYFFLCSWDRFAKL